jgi:hypothetical protein
MVPTFLMAQGDEARKGHRGGDLIGGDKQAYLEVVTTSTGASFYPVDQNGGMLRTMPVNASITMVAMDALTQEVRENIPLENGCFSVGPAGFDTPVYMYAIKYQHNGEDVVIKYRVPGVTPRN